MKDYLVRAMSKDGYVKAVGIRSTEIAERARQIHNTTPTATAALGRALTAASIMGNMQKVENGSLTLQFKGGGPIGTVLAVSDAKGNVRGYVDNPHVELLEKYADKLDVGAAVGTDGMLTVSRDIGLKEPYIGSVELVSGEIGDDLTSYMLSSEQIPSACGLGVLIDTDLSVKAAGGFIVQLMPGAPEEYIDILENNIFLMDQLTTILAEDGLEEVFTQVLKGLPYHIVDENEVGYRCYCSRERVADALVSIGSYAIEEMISDGKNIDVACQFCDNVYSFSPSDLKLLIFEDEKEQDN